MYRDLVWYPVGTRVVPACAYVLREVGHLKSALTATGNDASTRDRRDRGGPDVVRPRGRPRARELIQPSPYFARMSEVTGRSLEGFKPALLYHFS